MIKKAILRAMLRTITVVAAVAVVMTGGNALLSGINWVAEKGLEGLAVLRTSINQNPWTFVLLGIAMLLGSILLDFVYLKIKKRREKKAAKKAEKEAKKAEKEAKR